MRKKYFLNYIPEASCTLKIYNKSQYLIKLIIYIQLDLFPQVAGISSILK
jgi:hypothetical protein